MFILAHADHPELFVPGLIIGIIMVLGNVAWRRIRNRSRSRQMPLAQNLTAAVPRYWELEIRADTPGVDYAATFLVPIYAQLART